MKPKRFLLAIPMLFSLSVIAARADKTGVYWTDGCNECIYEYNDAADEYRYLEHVCGATCWTSTSWTSCGGNCSFHPPDPKLGGYEPVYNSNGFELVHVMTGNGGIIHPYSGVTGTGYAFTSDGSDVIRVPISFPALN